MRSFGNDCGAGCVSSFRAMGQSWVTQERAAKSITSQEVIGESLEAGGHRGGMFSASQRLSVPVYESCFSSIRDEKRHAI